MGKSKQSRASQISAVSKTSEILPTANALYDLPDGWMWGKIGDVADTTSGGTPPRQRADYFGGKIPWVKSGELEDTLITTTEETITRDGLNNCSAKMFPSGTALVALYGATVGKTGILGINAASNQAVCAIFPRDDAFTAEYVTLWLRSQRQTLIEMSTGGAQPNISQKVIRDFPIPLPPLPEQHRIVARIESLFAESRTTRAALERVPALLKRFRQSVLASAFRGELTEREPQISKVLETLEISASSPRLEWRFARIARGMDVGQD